ncbi:MAG TPA: OB-fold nucleic acid binding domain-containing protein [bacterium]|nr:OB-fold nucleic acid binding domain-containing protein [bacterium]HOL47907.1 OB-fold nucleic acid binding domain-containing protein [bacterium]HPQ19222.1 OB-fold nucleic acid binding domain-containing protein [bacterium]
MNWYISLNSNIEGPYTTEQIKEFYKTGKINNDTYVLKEGTTDWKSFGMTPEFQTKQQNVNQQKIQNINPSNVVDEEGLCPTCGYFAGSLLACPRCGASVNKKISLVLVKKISVIGSIIGIILLWYAAYLKQPITVNIGDIDEKMNGAFVRIEGKIIAYEENKEKNSLRMKIDDGTGIINISAFNKLDALKKIFKDRMPGIGDKVEIVGSINETQKFGISMFLSVPERLKIIEKFDLKEVELGKLTRKNVGDIVKIVAVVSSYDKRTTRKGTVLHSYVLRDKTGKIGLTLFDKAIANLPEETKSLFNVGNKLELIIRIGEYRGELQAEIVDFSKIVKVGEENVEEMKKEEGKEEESTEKEESKKEEPKEEIKENTVGNLKKSDVGKTYKFKLEVITLSKKSKGTLLKLKDENGDEIEMMVWDSLSNRISNFDKLKSGSQIEGKFEVSEYRNKLQLKIKEAEDLKIIKK